MKSKAKKIWISVVIGTILLTGLSIGSGYLFPVNALTPFWIELSKPCFQGKGGNLLLGNEHLNWFSPWLACLNQKAWNVKDCVSGLLALEEEGKEGRPIHCDVYSQKEQADDSQRAQTCLYALAGEKTASKRPFVITLAGGGFTSVCTPFESLPVAGEFKRHGYPSFAATYRLSSAFGVIDDREGLMDDIAACVSYLLDHADDWGLDTENYLMCGFSAGAMITSMWCEKEHGYEKYHLPAPKAACLLYGMDEEMTKNDILVPVFSLYCSQDPYFDATCFTALDSHLSSLSVAHDIKAVNVPHGFGLGTDTEAEGWVENAISFWNSFDSKDLIS